MSKSTPTRIPQMDGQVAQFCSVTGASVKEAARLLEKYKRLDVAIDAYYNEPASIRPTPIRHESSVPSTSKLNSLFDKYKDGDDIAIDGTIKFCEDLDVDPEDVVLLAVAFELKSTRVGEWNRKGWVNGWKSLGCDSIPGMKPVLDRLRNKLGSDPAYFQQVYNHTFDLARPEGQRGLGIDEALVLWELLLSHGLQGGALAYIQSRSDDEDEEDHNMDTDEEGWRKEYTQWWLEFLKHKRIKGVSKDTWIMFLDFVRTIDAKFETYDIEAAWPSLIDDFVEYAKERLGSVTT